MHNNNNKCYRSEETLVGPVIGGALGGLVLIIIIMVVVILTTRAIYKSFFATVKYTEVPSVFFSVGIISTIKIHRWLELLIIHCMMCLHLLT